MIKSLAHIRTFALAAAISTSTLTTMPRINAQAGQEDKAPKPVAIDIDNFRFSIVSIEVAAGTTVKWTNRDDVPHTVTSTTKLFKSGPLDTGEAFSYTFKDAGTFEYYCSLHPHMTAKILVK